METPYLELNIGGRKVVLYFNTQKTVENWTDYYCTIRDFDNAFHHSPKKCVLFFTTDEEYNKSKEASVDSGGKVLGQLLSATTHNLSKYLPDLVKDLTQQINKFIAEELASGKREVPKHYA